VVENHQRGHGNQQLQGVAARAEFQWTFHPTMSIGSSCEAHLRAKELPAGRLIVRLSMHVAAVSETSVVALPLAPYPRGHSRAGAGSSTRFAFASGVGARLLRNGAPSVVRPCANSCHLTAVVSIVPTPVDNCYIILFTCCTLLVTSYK
jgi:hypothetical protein